jgi:hypothetical protein
MYDDSKITDFQVPAADLQIISEKLLNNNDLCKLLYFANDTPFQMTLTDEQKAEIFKDEYIQIVPKIYAATFEKSNIIITFDNFVAGFDNPLYMSSNIIFDIIVPLSAWKIKDKQNRFTTLRPYEIAHLVQKGMNGTKLTGIGRCNFLGAGQILLPANEEVAGLTVRYSVENSDNDGYKLTNR